MVNQTDTWDTDNSEKQSWVLKEKKQQAAVKVHVQKGKKKTVKSENLSSVERYTDKQFTTQTWATHLSLSPGALVLSISNEPTGKTCRLVRPEDHTESRDTR